jgi:hypothetical protein
MECCGGELIDDTYFIRIAGPLSVNSRVSTKSNCGCVKYSQTRGVGWLSEKYVQTLWSGTISRFHAGPPHITADGMTSR